MAAKQHHRYITRAERIRLKKRRRRMRRLLFAAEVLAVLFFCYLLFSAIPKGTGHTKGHVDARAKESTLSETGTKAAARDMEKMTHAKGIVILDAGHGGHDVGCVRGDTYEKDLNLAIAQYAKTLLEEDGYRVVMIRDDDTYYALEDRTEAAAAYAGRDDAVFVSIHINALEDDHITSGIETYAREETNASSVRLAALLGDHVSERCNASVRKTETASDLYVVSHTPLPSALIEVGFLTSDTEYPLLTSASYQQKIAAGIADGIDAFFGTTTVDK